MGSLQCSSIDAALAEKSKHSIVRLEAELWDGLAGFTLDCGSTYRHLLGPALGEFIDRDADRARKRQLSNFRCLVAKNWCRNAKLCWTTQFISHNSPCVSCRLV